MQDYNTIIIGAGPAGLTAGYLLSENAKSCLILEMNPNYVGGISRTERYKDFYFDIGGHRFFSKSQEVEDFWSKILGSEMLERPRSSRIFYRKKFFSYPLKAFEALFKLGIFETIHCVSSYAWARVFPDKNAKSFEAWVTNQFGRRLFQIFFKTYTEKVWGMSCKEISADWAAQRIKGLSLSSAVINALKPDFLKFKGKKAVIKTLIESFRYPARGPGMMWEKVAADFKKQGGELQMGYRVTGLRFDLQSRVWTVTAQSRDGQKLEASAQNVISTCPMRELMTSLEPKPQSLGHAEQLRYRDFITVALVVNEKNLFQDNWIYIHDPSVKVGRVQNFKSWSPYMVPNEKVNCYGLEYFCHEGDNLWSQSNESLIEMAKQELVSLGLAEAKDILDGCVVRQEKAYPVYDQHYTEHVDAIRSEIETSYPGLHLIGRNGMHKYNNQDHAMMTAMLAVKNILAEKKLFDVWQVNQDAEYHETVSAADHNADQNLGVSSSQNSAASGLRQVPVRTTSGKISTRPSTNG